LFPKDRKPFDIQDLFFRFTLDSATDFLFGEPVGSLALPDASDGMNMRPKDQQLNFTEAFNTAQAYCNLRSRAASLYWLINPKSFRDSIKTVHTLVDYYVDLAVQSQATSQEKSQEKDQEKGREKERYIFLEALAAETKDRKVLRDQLLNILLAGRDTTASLLSSVFYFLARDQAAWKKLREEIIHAFGKGKASSGITFSSLKQLTYLRYVVNESESHSAFLVPFRVSSCRHCTPCLMMAITNTPTQSGSSPTPTTGSHQLSRCPERHDRPRGRWPG
jgi:cytochrome P450